MSLHLWHDISMGKNIPHVVDAVVEIPQDARAKYELDKETGLLRLDRVLFTPMHYPANYGFLPQTLCGDGDPLDILIYSQVTLVPMCLVQARPVGVIRLLDGGEEDDKIIAVADKDVSMNHVQALEDMPEYLVKELTIFFEDYKKLEGKTVEILGVDGKEAAWKAIEESMGRYQEKFPQVG